MDLAIKTINDLTRQGKDVVANYVVRQKDWERFEKEIETQPQIVVTLLPRLEVAQSQREDRKLLNGKLLLLNTTTALALHRLASAT